MVTSLSFLVLQFLVFFFASAAMGKMPMQFSRAELVRIAGYGEEKLSSVHFIGTLLCETCFEPGYVLKTSGVSGAKVVIVCKTGGEMKRIINSASGTTDEYGEFVIELPSQLHAMPKLEEACMVRILSVPKNLFCQLNSGVNLRPVKLFSVRNSVRVYTAGTVRLHHKVEHSLLVLKKQRILENTW